MLLESLRGAPGWIDPFESVQRAGQRREDDHIEEAERRGHRGGQPDAWVRDQDVRPQEVREDAARFTSCSEQAPEAFPDISASRSTSVRTDAGAFCHHGQASLS